MATTTPETEISLEAMIGIAAAGIAAFMGTLTVFIAKGYNFDLPNMPQTPFGWMTFFAAITALSIVVAIGFFTWILWNNRGSFLGVAAKIAFGVWSILITLAVAFIGFRMFYAN